MIKRVLVLLFALSSISAQNRGQVVETGKYRLHKFEQAIGEETFELRRDNDSLILTDNFLFTDRGSAVPLETTFRAAFDLTPESFTTKGKVSRFSPIDNSVLVDRDVTKIRQTKTNRESPTPKTFFTISGYSPIAQQMLMIRYWLTHGRPAALPILPQSRSVQITERGSERIDLNGKQITVKRYNIAGLIWGREVVWLDSDSRLIAAVTTDAEFDHFEATAEGYESLLPKFVAEAASDGMAVLSELAVGAKQNVPLAIVGATLVDGTGRPSIADSTVVIDKGRIVAAGPRRSVTIPGNAKRFDAKGKTLLPGLWDMHAHFEQVEWGPIYLAAGVTTIRDVGNELEFIEAVRDAVRDGRGIGPQLLLAGVVDGSGPMALGVERVDSSADAARWVDEYKKHGFQQMKIYSSVTLDNIKSISEEAHKRGMTVTGHIPEGVNLDDAVEAGMDQVNHIQYLLAALIPPPSKESGDTPQLRSLAMTSINVNGPEAQKEYEFLKAHKTVMDPTMAVTEVITHPASEPLSKIEPGIEKVAPELAEALNNIGVPPQGAEMAKVFFEKSLALVGALHKAGVTIVAGTDQSVPGHSLYRELELYVQAGFTPMEAIQAATLVPSQVMGMDKQTGTVEVGKRADLVLLDANPLDDIHNIRTAKYVVANGSMYPTAKLWQTVGFKP